MNPEDENKDRGKKRLRIRTRETGKPARQTAAIDEREVVVISKKDLEELVSRRAENPQAAKYFEDARGHFEKMRAQLSQEARARMGSTEVVYSYLLNRIKNDKTLDQEQKDQLFEDLGPVIAQDAGREMQEVFAGKVLDLQIEAGKLDPDATSERESLEKYIQMNAQAVNNMGRSMELLGTQVAENLRTPTRERLAEMIKEDTGRDIDPKKISQVEYEKYVINWFNTNLKTLESYNEAFEEHSYFMGQMFSALMQIESRSETEKIGRKMREEFETRKTFRRAVRAHELVPPDQAASETGKLDLAIWEKIMTLRVKDWQGNESPVVWNNFKQLLDMGAELDEKRWLWRKIKYDIKVAEERKDRTRVYELAKELDKINGELSLKRAEMKNFFRHGGIALDSDGNEVKKRIIRRTDDETLKELLRDKPKRLKNSKTHEYEDLVEREGARNTKNPLNDAERARLDEIRQWAETMAVATGDDTLRDPKVAFQRELDDSLARLDEHVTDIQNAHDEIAVLNNNITDYEDALANFKLLKDKEKKAAKRPGEVELTDDDKRFLDDVRDWAMNRASATGDPRYMEAEFALGEAIREFNNQLSQEQAFLESYELTNDEPVFVDEALTLAEEDLKFLQISLDEGELLTKKESEGTITFDEKLRLQRIRKNYYDRAIDEGMDPNTEGRIKIMQVGKSLVLQETLEKIDKTKRDIEKWKEERWARLQAGRILSVSWLAGYYDLSDFGGTGDFFGARLLNYGDSWLPRRGLLQKTRGIWEPQPIRNSRGEYAAFDWQDSYNKEFDRLRNQGMNDVEAGRFAKEWADKGEDWMSQTGGFFMLNPKTPDMFTRLLDSTKITVKKDELSPGALAALPVEKVVGSVTERVVPIAWLEKRRVSLENEIKRLVATGMTEPDARAKAQELMRIRHEMSRQRKVQMGIHTIDLSDEEFWAALRRASTPEGVSPMAEPAFAVPEQLYQSDQVDEITAAEATRKIFWSAQSFFHNPTLDKLKEANVLFKHISEWNRQDEGWGDILRRTLDWMRKDAVAKEVMEELNYFPKLEMFRWIEEASGDEMITNEMRDKFLQEFVGKVPLLKPRTAAMFLVNVDIIWGLWKHPTMVMGRISDVIRKFFSTIFGQTFGEDIGARR